MPWLLWVVLALCAVAIAAIGVSAYGSKRWTVATLALTRKLDNAAANAKSTPLRPTVYNSDELNGLPAPVQRYFRMALRDGQPIIAAANVELAGKFNMSAHGAQWKPFTSRQRVVTDRPGFLWDARVSMMPGLPVRVVDSYIAGRGLLRAAILGLFTVAEVAGDGEIARGEFMRFFAEAAWYPTALLPGQGVRWDPVDDHSANATIVDGPLTLTLLFRFNDANQIDSFRAEARGAMDGKEITMIPWEGKWSNYQTRDGMTVPLTGEVAWMRPEGRKPYFVGTVTSLAYEFLK
ncbi:MAG: hypothetical protein JWR21_2771 [Herminiimonas sp.]|nr:hypothetical protein [Herminiimonas sp.]MDB5853088.1 hypothetical protein [Herminiimonas sp.]